jgi:hypothetical protein
MRKAAKNTLRIALMRLWIWDFPTSTKRALEKSGLCKSNPRISTEVNRNDIDMPLYLLGFTAGTRVGGVVLKIGHERLPLS